MFKDYFKFTAKEFPIDLIPVYKQNFIFSVSFHYSINDFVSSYSFEHPSSKLLHLKHVIH